MCKCRCSDCTAPCSLWRVTSLCNTNHKCLFHTHSTEPPLLSAQAAFESWKDLLQSSREWADCSGKGFKSCADDKSESWLEVREENGSLVLVVAGLPFCFATGWQSLVSDRFKTIKFIRCRFKEAVGLAGDDPHAPEKEHNKDCDGKKAAFNTRVLFERCIFEKSVRLWQVRTEHPLEFWECCFQGYFEINSCCIAGLNCHDSLFQQKTYLEDLKINELSNSSQFTKQSAEASANSKLVADFSEAVFEGGAVFWNVNFHGSVSFKRAEFYEASDFTNLRFPIGQHDEKLVYFSMEAAHIEGSLGIRGIPSERRNSEPTEHWSVFEAEGKKNGVSLDDGRDQLSESKQFPLPLRVNLKHISIHKDGGFVLQACNMERAEVLGTNWGRCVFLGVIWPQVRATYWMWILRVREWHWPFDALSIVGGWLYDLWGWCLAKRLLAKRHVLDHFKRKRGHIYGLYDHQVMQEKLECEGTLLARQYHSHRNQVKEERVKQWREWRHSWALISKAYRDLKKSYEENKDYIYASDFNFGEKEMRRINHEVPRFTRAQLDLFYYLSGYGERILRPCILLLVLWVAGVIAFTGAQAVHQNDCNDDMISVWRAMYVSAANMALLRPNDLTPGLFTLLQAILGPTLGAMLVLAITNKLKR